jgi:AcrR family transcriptional regulator
MTGADTVSDVLPQRPMRADARRNYDKLISAAREAFTNDGASASLEDIARRARVGIGTLYRHFPTRQALLEAVYVDEVEALCRSAEDLAGLAAWDALVAWLRRFVGYVATKRALAEELIPFMDRDAEVFQRCRTAITAVGESLLERAQQSGAVRADANFWDVARMVGGIAAIQTSTPEQIERILDIALDGLRYQAPAP